MHCESTINQSRHLNAATSVTHTVDSPEPWRRFMHTQTSQNSMPHVPTQAVKGNCPPQTLTSADGTLQQPTRVHSDHWTTVCLDHVRILKVAFFANSTGVLSLLLPSIEQSVNVSLWPTWGRQWCWWQKTGRSASGSSGVLQCDRILVSKMNGMWLAAPLCKVEGPVWQLFSVRTGRLLL